jgi:hypothetical protein
MAELVKDTGLCLSLGIQTQSPNPYPHETGRIWVKFWAFTLNG